MIHANGGRERPETGRLHQTIITEFAVIQKLMEMYQVKSIKRSGAGLKLLLSKKAKAKDHKAKVAITVLEDGVMIEAEGNGRDIRNGIVKAMKTNKDLAYLNTNASVMHGLSDFSSGLKDLKESSDINEEE